MSKELDDFYKMYSARMKEIDDTPLVKVMDGGRFKMLSIEEYEEMINKINAYKQLEQEFKNKGRPNTIEDNNVDYDNCNVYAMRQKIKDLEAKLAESEKNFIVANNLKKNSDEVLLNYKSEKYGLDKTIQELRKIKLNLPEKEWYYKGFENCERQISSHIADLTLEVKELKQQLTEKNEEIEELKFIKRNTEQALNNVPNAMAGQRKRIDELTKELKQTKQDKISFALEQLEKVKEFLELKYFDNEQINYLTRIIDNQIKQLKEQ